MTGRGTVNIATRSSADADNAFDAFSGQSRPCGISGGTLTHVRHMTLSRHSITMSWRALRAARYGQLKLYTLAYTTLTLTLTLTLMSTKPNPNPNPSLTLTLCAIVDVAPAAANTIWIMTLRCTTRVYRKIYQTFTIFHFCRTVI